MNLPKPKFKIGQYVRISGTKKIFFGKIINIRMDKENEEVPLEYSVFRGRDSIDYTEEKLFEITEEEKEEYFIEGFFDEKQKELHAVYL